MQHRARDLLLRQQTQVINALRAHLAELGIVAGMARRPFKVVAIALANKMARVAWALLARGGKYRAPAIAAAA